MFCRLSSALAPCFCVVSPPLAAQEPNGRLAKKRGGPAINHCPGATCKSDRPTWRQGEPSFASAGARGPGRHSSSATERRSAGGGSERFVRSGRLGRGRLHV